MRKAGQMGTVRSRPRTKISQTATLKKTQSKRVRIQRKGRLPKEDKKTITAVAGMRPAGLSSTAKIVTDPRIERQPRPERAANTRKSAQGALPLSSLGNAITALRIVRIPTEKVHVCHFGLPRRRPAQRSQRATQPGVSRVPPIPPWLVHVADFMSDTT